MRPRDEQRIVRWYLADDSRTLRATAEQFGIGVDRVRAVLVRHEVEIRTRKFDRDRMRHLLKSKLSPAAVAKILGVSRQAIHLAAKREDP